MSTSVDEQLEKYKRKLKLIPKNENSLFESIVRTDEGTGMTAQDLREKVQDEAIHNSANWYGHMKASSPLKIDYFREMKKLGCNGTWKCIWRNFVLEIISHILNKKIVVLREGRKGYASETDDDPAGTIVLVADEDRIHYHATEPISNPAAADGNSTAPRPRPDCK